MSLIEVKNLCYAYDINSGNKIIKKNILNNISFTINKGEFICIIGKNGSGKSTLAYILDAINIPTSGDCIIDGMNTKNEKNIYDIRKKVGFIFQNPDNQMVASFVDEEIAFGLENLAIPQKEMRERVDNVLNKLNIYDLKDKSLDKLSGGQKQKVAIAGVLVMKPEIIILDEPTAMLDPMGRKEVIDEIVKLNKNENITIIHITHNIEEIINADKIFILNDGKIDEINTKEEMLKKLIDSEDDFIRLPEVMNISKELKKEKIIDNQYIYNIDDLVKEIKV